MSEELLKEAAAKQAFWKLWDECLKGWQITVSVRDPEGNVREGGLMMICTGDKERDEHLGKSLIRSMFHYIRTAILKLSPP